MKTKAPISYRTALSHTYITDLQIHFDENDIVKNYTLDEKKEE